MYSLVCIEARSYEFVPRLRGDLGLKPFSNTETVKIGYGNPQRLTECTLHFGINM